VRSGGATAADYAGRLASICDSLRATAVGAFPFGAPVEPPASLARVMVSASAPDHPWVPTPQILEAGRRSLDAGGRAVRIFYENGQPSALEVES
jgi:hypothetical protein